MRQEIQQRMNEQIAFSTKQNTIFDLVVTVIDESIDTTTFNGVSEFRVEEGGLRYAIQTNEDMNYGNGAIYVYIDDTTTNTRYANLNINTVDGSISEDYFTMPRAKRNAIFALFGDIIDAVDSYINNETTNE